MQLREDARNIIFPLLKQHEHEYVKDAYAMTLEQAFNRMKSSYVSVAIGAKAVASTFVSQTNDTNKDRFYKSLESTIAVNLQSIVQSEGLDDILTATTSNNVSLIKSIPDEYFKKIEQIVYSNTIQGARANSMISEIVKLGHSTTKRARFIARDQTSKLNSALNEQRQKNIGVEEYVWRTSGDEKVRDDHVKNNGKTFRWDTPPKKTGHPGNDPGCRCTAQAILDI